MRPPAPPRPGLLYLALGVVSWPVLRLVLRQRSSGVEHVPASGGAVLASNHWSNIDPWPLAFPLFPRRPVCFMGKAELFWFPLGAFLRGVGGFPVRRGERDTAAIETAVRLCREGHLVGILPEGTRRAKGLRKKHEASWKTGAARVALAAGVPLVPAAIDGTQRLARLGPLRVAYGPPIELGDLAGLAPEEAAAIATERLREAVLALEAALAMGRQETAGANARAG